ncbi:MAG TPA: response regulator [Opitutaceae bacterium]|nr:response regulator [Opitutaceae bacterium]
MKILIAEDDSTARALMSDILGSSGVNYDVIATEDGTRAWEALQANPDVGLAIVDLEMPELNGMQWLDRVRADAKYAKLPVIICTGDSDRETVSQAMARGVNSYLVKPFSRSSVLDKVLKAIRPQAAAAPSAATSALPDVAAVRARLAIDRDAHRSLLENHVRSADIWVTDARRASRFSEVRALAIRAGACRQASAAYGATLLAARFKEAEEALDVYRSVPASNAELQTCLNAAATQAGRVQPELVRLRASIDVLP